MCNVKTAYNIAILNIADWLKLPYILAMYFEIFCLDDCGGRFGMGDNGAALALFSGRG